MPPFSLSQVPAAAEQFLLPIAAGLRYNSLRSP